MPTRRRLAMYFSIATYSTFRLKGAHALLTRAILQSAPCAFNRATFLCNRQRHFTNHALSSDKDTLTMEKIYSEWTMDDDKLLYDNKDLPIIRLASLLGRGMHGVEARLKKLTNVDSPVYARLFADVQDRDDDSHGTTSLTPVKEVLRRIQWDPTLASSSFTILHYDRVENSICTTPFDAPNDSISGKETQFVFALPEHRIVGVKYLDRTVWDKETKLDLVFGSMNGNGITIDQIIETYDEWKKEREEREKRNQRWQVEILKEMDMVLEERRVGVLKDLSSNLLHSEWDTEAVRDYVKGVVGLHYDAKREKETDEENEQLIDFLYLFSDLVALLSDESLREEILKEVEALITRTLGDEESTKTNQPAALPELQEEDLSEKFVKGSGAGGQKINKTANKVILTHIPTQVRVECQETRSLQQNRKIAQKRLRLKVDAFINGESSRTSQKASVAVAKKAKNKARNKRRRQQKKQKTVEEG